MPSPKIEVEMAQKVIRDIPDEILHAIEVKAAESGSSTEAYIRDLLVKDASLPVIRKRYSFKAFSENGAYASIKREHDFVQRGAKNCSQEQFNAYQRACDYVERNELGDYEAAYKLLVQHFDEVFSK